MGAPKSRDYFSSFTSRTWETVPENFTLPSWFHCLAGPSATNPKKVRFKSRACGFVFQLDSDFFLPSGQNWVHTLRLFFRSCSQLHSFLPSLDQYVSAPVLRPLA